MVPAVWPTGVVYISVSWLAVAFLLYSMLLLVQHLSAASEVKTHCSGSLPQMLLLIIRPGQSQGLLYNHFRYSLTHCLTVCGNIFTGPPCPKYGAFSHIIDHVSILWYSKSRGHLNRFIGFKVTVQCSANSFLFANYLQIVRE